MERGSQPFAHPTVQIEQLIAQEELRERRTLPAEMQPTLTYELHNSFGMGVPYDVALGAAWRVERALQVLLPGCSLFLGVAPPAGVGERPLLLYTMDSADGTGTHLLGAWRLDPRLPTDLPAAFANVIVRYGQRVEIGDTRSLFFLRAAVEHEPRVEAKAKGADMELHRTELRDQWGTPIGWAWCFAINLGRYRRDQR